jgi:hypothetical protein
VAGPFLTLPFFNGVFPRCKKLLRLSKKCKWPKPIIFASLKINNLQATEKRKMPRFRVFRQPRYISIVSGASKIDAIWFPFIELGCVISFSNPQPPKQPSAEHVKSPVKTRYNPV